MASLDIEIGLKNKVDAELDAIGKEFTNLQSQAHGIGKFLSDDLVSAKNKAMELGRVYSEQLDILASQKKELAQIKEQIKDYSSRPQASLTPEDHTKMLALVKQRKELNEAISESEKSVKELGKSYTEAATQAQKALDKETKSVEKNADALAKAQEKAEEDSNLLGDAFKRAGILAASMFTIDKAVEFGQKVIQVRGEMQALEASFSAMLGSKEKADTMLKDAVAFAATTPFDLQSVAAGAKQLLAYGTAQENVLGDMKMLGDVAAGLNIPLSQLIYLYGTLRAQGRVMAVDIRQFAMRGIPIYDELAKVLGVAKSEVAGFVSAGKVTFETVEQAFKNMTSEGGKFGGLMDGVFNTVNGKISNLGDNIYQMYNDIGKSTDGIIMAGLNVVSAIVDNYKTIGKVIGDLVIVYGSYKAAVIAVTAAQKASIAIDAIRIASEKGFTLAMKARMVALRQMVTLQNLLNKTMLANPYVAATMAIVGLGVALVKVNKYLDANAVAQRKVNAEIEQAKSRAEEAAEIFRQMGEDSEAAHKTDYVDALIQIYPSLLEKYEKEKLLLMDIAELKKAAADIEILDRKGTIEALQKELRQLRYDEANYQDARKQRGTMSEASARESDARQRRIKAVLAELAVWEENYPEFFEAFGPPKPTQTGEGAVTKNKAYYEKMKKEALAALEAMSVDKRGSDEWNQYLKEYNEADKILKTVYDIGSKTKKETKKDTSFEKFNSAATKLSQKIDVGDKNITEYDKALADIRKTENELLTDLVELESKANEIKDEKEKSTALKSVQEKREEVEEYIKLLYARNFETLLSEYKGVDGELSQLEQEYARLESILIENVDEGNADRVTVALGNLMASYREKFREIYEGVDLSKFNDTEWMNSLAKRSTQAMAEELASLQAIFDIYKETGSLTEQEAVNLAAKIEILTKKLKEQEDTTKESASKWTDLYKVFSEVGSSLKQMGGELGGTSGEILKYLGVSASGVGKVFSSIQGIKDGLKNTDSLKKFTEVFSGVMGIAEVAVGVYSSVSSAVKEIEERTKALVSAHKEYNIELERTASLKRIDSYSNAFGTIDLNVFNEQLATARREMGNIRSYLGDIKWDDSIWFAPFVNTGDLFKNKTDTTIYSDNRSGLEKQFGFGAKKVIRADLMDFFDETGNLLGDELQIWYEKYGEGLSEENRKVIEGMLSSWEQMKSAMVEVEQYLSSLFGGVMDGIADTMYDNFVKTGNAMADLSEYAKGFQKELAKSVIKSTYLSKIFTDEAQKAISDSLAAGKTDEAISLYNSLIEQSSQMAPEIQKFLEGLNLNLSDAEEQATAGGFQTMSQDTGTELNGRFTALQISNEGIRQLMENLVTAYAYNSSRANTAMIAIDDIRQIQANALLELMSINDNTKSVIKPIKEMNDSVLKIKEKVSKL